MRFDQFESLLYDLYQMDVYLPTYRPKYRQLFKEMSYEQWSIDELKMFVDKKMRWREYADISEYVNWVTEFIAKMDRYETVNKKCALIFNVAKVSAMNVKDTLIAML